MLRSSGNWRSNLAGWALHPHDSVNRSVEIEYVPGRTIAEGHEWREQRWPGRDDASSGAVIGRRRSSFEPSLSKVHTAYSMASVETFSGTLLESQGGSVGRQRQVLPGRFLPDCCSCWLSGPPSIILDRHPSSWASAFRLLVRSLETSPVHTLQSRALVTKRPGAAGACRKLTDRSADQPARLYAAELFGVVVASSSTLRDSLAYREASVLENLQDRPNSPIVIPSASPAAVKARRVRCRVSSNDVSASVSAIRVDPAAI